MNKATFVILLALLLANVLFHEFVSGWRPYTLDAANPESAAYGVTYNAMDCLSYAAWAQQSRAGVFPFSNLYTASEHEALFVSPFFMAVGRLALFFSTTPLAVLNMLGLLLIPVFVLALASLCREIGFDGRLTTAVVCLAAGGGGVSWLPLLLQATPAGGALRLASSYPPDLVYHDLYPATAFIVYPFHTAALALLALLALLLARAEDAARPFRARTALFIVLASLCLSGTRPYEPLMVLAAYVLLAAASCAFAVPRPLRRRRFAVLACLAGGILPFSLYSLWVSAQPVWREFADISVSLLGDKDWASAFLLLWVLAALGAAAARSRLLAGKCAFFASWSLLVFVLLVLLHSGLTKLCGGCTLPLALLAGLGLREVLARLRRRGARAAVLVLASLLALGSPAVAYSRFARRPERVPAELFQALDALRADTTHALPCVFTDPMTGMYLPGLGACRVCCGHWSMTNDFLVKFELLRRLGLFQGGPQELGSEPAALAARGAELAAQLEGGTFRYLLLKTDAPLARELADLLAGGRALFSGRTYVLAAMTPEIGARLAERLDAPAAAGK